MYLHISGCTGSSLSCRGSLWLQYAGFSCCGAQAVGTQASVAADGGLWSLGSVVALHGLSCPTACEIFWTRDQTSVPCIGRQILNQWVSVGSDSKESACNAGDQGSIPGSGRPPGEGNGSPLQCFCLENPMNRGAWQATVHGVTKSD